MFQLISQGTAAADYSVDVKTVSCLCNFNFHLVLLSLEKTYKTHSIFIFREVQNFCDPGFPIYRIKRFELVSADAVMVTEEVIVNLR